MGRRNTLHVLLAMSTTALLFGSLTREILAEPARPPQRNTFTITSLSPQGLTNTTNQIRATFSEPMAKLGSGNAPVPFSIKCRPAAKGLGHWADTKTWVYNFSTDLGGNHLPGGSHCEVEFNASVVSLGNRPISGKKKFEFTVDGPNILSMIPGDASGRESSLIAEDQAFVLNLDAAVKEDSVLAHSYFTIDGVSSPIRVRILKGDERTEVLRAYDLEATDRVLVIQPQTVLPSGKPVSLVWGPNILAVEGHAKRKTKHVVRLNTRPEFRAELECERMNARSGCTPLSEILLNFNADISAEQAAKIKLVAEDGTTIVAGNVDPALSKNSTVMRVTFPATFKEKTKFRIVLPEQLQDDAKRPLSNQTSFPLLLQTSDLPPLTRFAANFGIIEAAYPVLPVTLRNLEPLVQGTRSKFQGQAQRVGSSSFPEVVRWLKLAQAKNAAMDDSYAPEYRDTPLLSGNSSGGSSSFEVPLANNGKAFEVVGLPLDSKGFYVVELKSPSLGSALLGSGKTMYVAATALVTNMVVHSKTGKESSLFWVTSLDAGQPVSNANVAVHDCKGNTMWSGTTDSKGRAFFKGSIAALLKDVPPCRETAPWSKQEGNEIYSSFNYGFFVSASTGDDFTFTHSSWKDGIEIERFGLPAEGSSEFEDSSSAIIHTVLDRTLLRAGETVNMKHFMRAPTSSGFALPIQKAMPNQLIIRNYASETKYEQPLKWNADGTAESSLTLPPEAQLGTYSISMVRTAADSDESGDVYFPDSGSFRVMEFKVPLLKGSIVLPKEKLRMVQPGTLEAHLSVMRQNGGPAANQPVTFRYSTERDWGYYFEEFSSMVFGLEKLVEKTGRIDYDDDGDRKSTHETRLTLSPNGDAVVTIPGLSGMDSGRVVATEMEFVDVNGEVQTTARRVKVYPAANLVGIAAEDAYLSKKTVQFKVAVVDLDGKPLKNIKPNFEIFSREVHTNRVRGVGGVYSSESFEKVKNLNIGSKVECGAMNRFGVMKCQIRVAEGGDYLIQASTTDAQGNKSFTHASVFVRGQNRRWFPPSPDDRMDLVAIQQDVTPGTDAQFEVQMPFAEATVLVTVEREGVLESFVRHLSSQSPVISIPVKPEWAPNVFVSALAVRGRITDAAPETAMVDLGKPSYKLGLTQLNLKWRESGLRVAVKPVKEVYKPRETATIHFTVYDPAGKPAANSELAVAVVDEGLLELAKNRTWDLLRAMMGERFLGVETATAQMQVVGKRHFGSKAKPTGGDGGQAPSRELFDTLLHWQGRLKTNSQGQAQLAFPMNDSLTKFRVVAIAHRGVHQFGTGEASILNKRDVEIVPAIGTVARFGDNYIPEINIRNSTQTPKTITLKGSVRFQMPDGSQMTADLGSGTQTIGPLDSANLALAMVKVPEGAIEAQVQLRAIDDENGATVDSYRHKQTIKPALLPRIWMSELQRLDGPWTSRYEMPSMALAGQGGLTVSLIPSLTSGLDSVKKYFDDYPFASLEHSVSRAIALEDLSLWQKAMQTLPVHLGEDGLLKYFPKSKSSSDALTAYVLSVADYASTHMDRGFSIPAEIERQLLAGLQRFVNGSGRTTGAENMSDLERFVRRVRAIEVLARYDMILSDSLSALPQLSVTQLPTATVIDLISLQTLWPDANDPRLKKAATELRARLTQAGTDLILNPERGSGLLSDFDWLSSVDTEQLRLITVLVNHPGLAGSWSHEIPLLVRGALSRIRGGAWDVSLAAAYGRLALRSYGRKFESEDVSGITRLAMGQKEYQYDWSKTQEKKGTVISLGFPDPKIGELTIHHQGTGLPWALLSLSAAVPLKDPVLRGFDVIKEISPRQEKYRKGDIVTVQLTVKPQADLGQVAVMDPIPAGATILGGVDDDFDNAPTVSGWVWPDAEELTYEAYRASYVRVPRTGMTIKYKLRLNYTGTFQLPATRVEAIYRPENFAELPNSAWQIIR